MTRQRVIETDADVRTALPLVPAALQHVAHVAIRTRGTIGGSLAHADPSAELPAAVIALEGRLHLRSTRGTRAVAADDFFIGALMTALEPGELIEAVELPVPPAHTGWGFHEIAATRGAFALAGAVAMVRVDATGAIEHARLALMGIGATTVVPGWLADTSRGRRCDEELLADIRSRLQESLSPTDDVHASAAYRRRAAATIAVRALRDAARRAGGVEA